MYQQIEQDFVCLRQEVSHFLQTVPSSDVDRIALDVWMTELGRNVSEVGEEQAKKEKARERIKDAEADLKSMQEEYDQRVLASLARIEDSELRSELASVLAALKKDGETLAKDLAGIAELLK